MPHGVLPSHAYQAGVIQEKWYADTNQEYVLLHFDRIYQQLSTKPTPHHWFSWLHKPMAIKGLYLWGAVGRGKTFLMDLLTQQLLPNQYTRIHFHYFMQQVHDQLHQLRQQKTINPLQNVATLFSEKPLLCLDEFLVHDIGDAMILAELLKALFKQGTILITTSNTPPKNLYQHGLQRAKFLPAIALLEKHCDICVLDSATDYRLRTLTQSTIYSYPHNAQTQRRMELLFTQLAPVNHINNSQIMIHNRIIPVVHHTTDIAWFTFNALCEGPRAAADYITLAKTYHTIFISNIPQLTAMMDNAAKRFIHLIDALYDQHVTVVVTAEKPITELYCGIKLQAEFARTQSRLIEMQSEAYFVCTKLY